MPLEEVNDRACFVGGEEFLLELRAQGERAYPMLNRAVGRGRAVHFRCRSGLCGDKKRAQANEYGSQNLYLLIGDRGAAPRTGPLVSLARGTLAEDAREPVTPLTVP
jgi:hypothetical protein